MSKFLAKITDPDEKILYLAKLHWIYVLIGSLWFGGLVLLGLFLDEYFWENFGTKVPLSAFEALGIHIHKNTPMLTFLCTFLGFAIFLIMTVKVLATEIAVTNRRVIYKTGLFADVEDIRYIELIEQNIEYGLLGRTMNYGRIELTTRFDEDIILPAIRNPEKMIETLEKTRPELADDLPPRTADTQEKPSRAAQS